MQFVWKTDVDSVDWDALSALYKIAPLGDKHPDTLRTSFGNSMFRFFVYESGRMVGVGRALADGADCSYICDVAIHPEYQGTGLGKEIVTRLMALSKGHKKIILYAVPGKEPFYEKLGFRYMTTAMAIFDDQATALGKGLIVA